MHFWHWAAYIAVWFFLGPLFVMLFTTLGLEYYTETGRPKAPSPRDPQAGTQASPRAPLMGRRAGAATDALFPPEYPRSDRPPVRAGVELAWWTDSDEGSPPRRRVAGDH